MNPNVHPGDQTISSRHSNLRKSFKLGIRSVLTAVSKEDVQKVFSAFTDAEREKLYRKFLGAINLLHDNIEREFEDICQETEVGNTLDMIEKLVEEQSLDVLSKDETSISDIKKEKISRAKKEIQDLTTLIEKVEEQNNIMKARIEFLREKQDFSVTTEAVEKLRNWNANYEH